MSVHGWMPDKAMASDSSACAVGAHSVLRVPFAEIAGLRKNPGPLLATSPPASLMKHADHQTVLAITAVRNAARDAGWSERSFEDWAVLVAPRYFGRVLLAVAMSKYNRVGPSGVSPLIVPTLSLHAASGSLSLAIQSRGFNYSVSGGPNHLGEALLTGLAARDEGVPGVWVVATGFDPEPAPDAAGNSLNAAFGYAVALALVPESSSLARLNLRLVPTAAASEDQAAFTPPSLPALARFLEDTALARKPRRWFAAIPGGGAIEIEDDPSRLAATPELGTKHGSRAS